MRRLWALWLMLWLAPQAALAVAPAGGLAALETQGQLSISAAMGQAEPLVPGQRGELVIEVATSGWFSGGTRIRLPEVPGLVILQTEGFASNASERRGGRTWVVQRWSLDVYPQQAGRFSIPPIALQLQVNVEDSEASGEINSPPVSLQVVVPPALANVESWVASPQFEVSQQFDRPLEGLVPGDAVERRISFSASDVQAMMLPEYLPQAPAGLAAYPAPPVLDNRNNRGISTARRVQAITYVVEQPGDYRLPEQDYYWWNTASNSLAVLTLDAVAFTVTGDAPAAPFDWRRLLSATAVLAVAVLAGWLWYRYRPGAALWRLLARPLAWVAEQWQAWRQPPLPQALNPDSSAAGRKASAPR